MPSLLPLTEALAAGERAATVDAALVARLVDLAGDFAVNLLIAALILAATVIASRWGGQAARRALGRLRGFRRDQTILNFLVEVIRLGILIIGLIAVLQRLGVQTTSIIAVLGAASLAVGLALQGTLSNVAAGVLLLVLRPYRVGDIVQVRDVSGSVQKLDLFTTQLSNASNHRIVVPNSQVLGDVIVNLSGQRTRRVEINFTVGYGERLDAARAVLKGVAVAHETVLADPEPWTGVTGLLDSAVQITLHAWVASGDWWQTQADLMQGGKEALDAAGIEIPFPHQVEVPGKNAAFARAVAVPTETQQS
ncbi:MAG: mechanosensitive ion channel family protein [Brevundimonas sp.]|jgi:small conductance mechanosensitive channel|uniref:mechanosensitive ion channel family protein n=1 Tax=Brevundimonas sp. TaxID=1871086 RepID=UPI0022C4E1E0|nr:mechanosensitive ion channel family protein [Brevundimonas sp.]MCZ8088049.1 mechanosensitive ion channel family protein [Brevundimonas sp.]MCZ8194633.1 mechanosensitive ion channel family protein [Brevundimonas sp.]